MRFALDSFINLVLMDNSLVLITVTAVLARLNFPGGPVVRTVCFHYKGTGLMPDWGIRILHACRVAWQINE